MKIGDEVYIHGYVDEIRPPAVIVRNDGGYFGTIASEVKLAPAAKCVARITVDTEAIIKRIKEEYDLADGEWTEAEDNRHKCSRCGEKALTYMNQEMNGCTWEEEYLTEFCPFCGATMKGEADANDD